MCVIVCVFWFVCCCLAGEMQAHLAEASLSFVLPLAADSLSPSLFTSPSLPLFSLSLSYVVVYLIYCTPPQ